MQPLEQDGPTAVRPPSQQRIAEADVRPPPPDAVLPPKPTLPPASPAPAAPPKPLVAEPPAGQPSGKREYASTGLVLVSVALVLAPILAIMWFAGTRKSGRPYRPATTAMSPPVARPGPVRPVSAAQSSKAQGQLTIRMPENVTVDMCSIQLRQARGATREISLAASTSCSVEAGEYEIASAQIRVTDGHGTPWRYSLRTPGLPPGPQGEVANPILVEADKESVIRLFADPRITFEVTPERVRPGQTVRLSMTPTVGHGMQVFDCRREATGQAAQGNLVVHRPDGSTLKRGQEGFG